MIKISLKILQQHFFTMPLLTIDTFFPCTKIIKANIFSLLKKLITLDKRLFSPCVNIPVGHHSTSDDSSIYRAQEEVEQWVNQNNPVKKLQNYVKELGLMNDEQELEHIAECKKEVLSALTEGEKYPLHSWKEMFYDIYYKQTNNLTEQMEKMEKHLQEYGQHYPLKKHV